MKARKRLLGIMLSLVLMAGMLPVLSMPVYATDYNVWICNTLVTSDNAENIFNDGTASYDASTSTLKLNNFNRGYTPGSGGKETTIYATQDLKIELVGNNTADHGIKVYSGNLTIIGSGDLISRGDNGIEAANIVMEGTGEVASVGTLNQSAGIQAYNSMTIKSGTVNASYTGENGSGILANSGSVTITGGKVDASSTNNNCSGIKANTGITISGGDVYARGKSAGFKSSAGITITGGKVRTGESGAYGIWADTTVTISGGDVTASGRYAILAPYGVSIEGGNVTASGIGDYSEGISTEHAGVMIKDGSKVTASGTAKSINRNVINEIAGTGWTDKEGTQGKASIPVSASGQSLDSYRKVQFPADPDPAPTPGPAVNSTTIRTVASPSSRAMTVKWNKVDGAKSYKVSYRKVGSNKWTTKTTRKTSYVFKGHKLRRLYEYKVAAVTASGEVWSGVSHRYYKGVKTKIKAGEGSIKASWKKDSKASGYQVQIATNRKMDGAQLIDVAASEKSYKVTGLEKGKKYYVRVRPVKASDGIEYKGIFSKTRKVTVK